jgi:hypothetical protein
MEDVPEELFFAGEFLPSYKDLGWEYDYHPVDDNFDPTATSCAVLVTVQGATGSSPTHILLFHHGEFVGTGRKEGAPFVTLLKHECTDDTVAVSFKIPGRQGFAGPAKEQSNVKFRWLSGPDVVMREGPLPPPIK